MSLGVHLDIGVQNILKYVCQALVVELIQIAFAHQIVVEESAFDLWFNPWRSVQTKSHVMWRGVLSENNASLVPTIHVSLVVVGEDTQIALALGIVIEGGVLPILAIDLRQIFRMKMMINFNEVILNELSIFD